MLISRLNQNTQAVEWPLVNTQSKRPLDILLSGQVAGLSLDRTLAYCVVTQKCSTDQDSLRRHCMSKSQFLLALQLHKLCLWFSYLIIETSAWYALVRSTGTSAFYYLAYQDFFLRTSTSHKLPVLFSALSISGRIVRNAQLFRFAHAC